MKKIFLIKFIKGTHYKWTIGYGDCGTTQTVDEDLGTVTFSNKMVTWIDQEAPVFPVVPEFDVDLTCVVSTKFEFVFHGDFYPELTSFRGVKNVAGENLEHFVTLMPFRKYLIIMLRYTNR